MTAKVISFDMDGTLSKMAFTTSVWNEGLPKRYAKTHSVDLEKAKKVVSKEYDRIGDQDLRWYDLRYWFDRFSLKGAPLTLLEEYEHEVEFYPEVEEVLNNLQKKYKLVISSNAADIFISKQLKKLGKKFFSSVFSSISDFNLLKKDPSFYLKVCHQLRIHPSELIHVGDNCASDYLSPKKVGISAYYLDRNATESHDHVVTNLKELLCRVTNEEV